MSGWETVIGLETHVELLTKTKIFCSCSTGFGGEPNTRCCPVCTGQPGSLPVLNEKAVELAVRAGLALNCRINPVSAMDRKHYVYPDLPKAYQITQFDVPLCEAGFVDLPSGKRIGITRIHIEEDAGKLVRENGKTYIDYNRGGVPLIEIVTEPDFRSAQEVTEYLELLRLTMRGIGVSDCKMQEGSLRCDVNVSLRKPGEPFGTRTEIKNLNSFTAVAAAIESEVRRQKAILDSGGRIVQQTRHFDAARGETADMRGKEDAEDYRFFPEPDLPKIVLSPIWVEQLRKTMPELPAAKKDRYVQMLRLAPDDAAQLVKFNAVADYFEQACRGLKDPRIAAGFILTQMFAILSTEAQRENWSPSVTAGELRELSLLVERGSVSKNVAKTLLARMLETKAHLKDLLSRQDVSALDEQQFRQICRQALTENERAVADYRRGKDKAIKALVGAVMRASAGRADPIEAERQLRMLLEE